MPSGLWGRYRPGAPTTTDEGRTRAHPMGDHDSRKALVAAAAVLFVCGGVARAKGMEKPPRKVSNCYVVLPSRITKHTSFLIRKEERI